VTAVGRLGTSGIILANAVSMTIRIANNMRYILRMFAQPTLLLGDTESVMLNHSQQPGSQEPSVLASLRPPTVWMLAVLFSIVVTKLSAYLYAHTSQSLQCAAVHVAVGGVTALLFLAVTLRCAPGEDAQWIRARLPFVGRAQVTTAKKEL
jgi:cytochrome bd-type quinol oxidase subunit 2